jgi:cytochrome c553
MSKNMRKALIKGVLGGMAAGAVTVATLASTPRAASSAAIEPSPQTQPGRAAPALGQQPTTTAPVASVASPEQQLVNRYCITCHNERLKTANLMLDKVDVTRVTDDAEMWERIIAKLRGGAMPPAGAPRPDKAVLEAFISSLENTIDRAAKANPNPGRPEVHRLNRAEYTNAIRDLLGLEIDGESLLPPDDSGYGFANIADLLSMSPALMERYLSAAHKISRLAVGDITARPLIDLYMVPEAIRQEERASEDLPFGTRGGTAVRRHFPVDGEYSVNIRMKTAVGQNELIGSNRETPVEVRLDGALVKQFTFGRAPAPNRGRGGVAFYGGDDVPENYEFRFPVKAGTHVVGVTFPHETLELEDLSYRFPTADYSFLNDSDADPRIDSVEIGGPYNITGAGETPSRQRVFVCRPATSRQEAPCAEKIVSALARRAYRSPLTDEDMQPLLAAYRSGRGGGRNFDSGIQAAIERMLLSPRFLFRVETGPDKVAPGTAYRVHDVDLASRLSFFLWSSIPDDELLDLASRGRLKDPRVLQAQVRRMLADSRASALVQNFGGQWLFLRDLDNVKPDFREYPEFDDELREAFRLETELFFESQLREDRSVVDMLRADYTFLNERLAQLYGIPNVYGTHFRRVQLTDPNRRGVLGQSSILTVTSYANRTSPVKRGKWVLENILGAPPPAPPPDVPALQETGGVKYKSMRERMDAHRKMPTCAACHARIDPLGFAMDNFDGIGKWRTHEGTSPVDASGVLDGVKFNGTAELRTLLLNRQEEFVTNVTKKLLTYGLGRGAEYYDMPAVRQIVRQAAAEEFRWSSLITGVINSVPFQMRRTQ